MLDYLGHCEHANLIRDSVMDVLCEKKIHTPDLGGTSTTLEVVQAIIEDIKPKARCWSDTVAQNLYSTKP